MRSLILACVAFVIALAAPLDAQTGATGTPPSPAEIAVFRGKVPSPAQLADLTPLERQWLDAAQKPGLARADALLALAAAHPQHAARALLGATGAILAAHPSRLGDPWPGIGDGADVRDRVEAEQEPYLEPVEEFGVVEEPEDPWALEDLALEDVALADFERHFLPRLERAQKLLQELESQHGDREDPLAREMLDEAAAMLRTLRRTKAALPLHVPCGSALRIPAPRPHTLELRWFRCTKANWSPEQLDSAVPCPEPHGSAEVPAGAAAPQLRVPETPGHYLLELREAHSGWRAVRPVLVSDLAFDALLVGSHVAIAARRGEAPAAGATVALRTRSGLLLAEGRTGADGLALLPIPRAHAERHERTSLLLELVSHGHFAQASVRGLGEALYYDEALSAHVFCERPLYRPGETVRGRILLRRIRLDDGRPEGELLRRGHYVLTLRPGTADAIELRGYVDPSGALHFETRLPETIEHGPVAGTLQLEGYRAQRLGSLFVIDPFRRSPLVVELDAPDALEVGRPGHATLRARWSHGSVAAGAPVTVSARLGDATQTLESELGPDGTLRIALPHDDELLAARRRLYLQASVRGPDGQGVHVARGIASEATRTETPSERKSPVIGTPPSPLVPRSELRVPLRYRPHARGLCVLTLHRHVDARVVQFDARGEAEPRFWLPEDSEDLAFVHVVAEGRDASLRLRIQRPERDLRITLESETRSYRPGAQVRLRLRVQDATGQPVRASLCAALVDERLLALRDIDDVSRVRSFGLLDGDLYAIDASAFAVTAPWRLAGELLLGGRPDLPLRGLFHSVGAGGSPGGAYGASAALAIPDELLRKDFRSSVGYVGHLKTDAEGRVEHDFELPHDLTTWRLRVVAIDDALGQGAARFALVTEKPLAVEAALPRYLRLGDHLRTTPSIAAAPDVQPEWAASASDELALEHGPRPEDGIELHARALGEAHVELAVRAGLISDALRRPLPVLRDTVREERSAHVTASTAWQTVGLEDADELEELVISAGRAAQLAMLRERLERYPYRCAEQTSSRLLGLYGRAKPNDAMQQLEAEVMFARLRELWHARELGFSWWPGQDVDREITVLVLHALAELGAVGHPLSWLGLETEESSRRRIARQLDALRGEPDLPAIALAEHAIGLLRLATGDTKLRGAVQGFVRAHAGLPRGLLCRAGLAFVAAGQDAAAREVAGWLRSPLHVRFAGLELGEDLRVQMALELRLLQLLDAADTERAHALEEGLLRQLEREGFGHTWAAACTLQALDRKSASASEEDPLPEEIAYEARIDGKLVSGTLRRATGYRQTHALQGKPRIELRSSAGRELRVRLAGARHRPAATFAAQGEGLAVTRSLVDLAPSGAIERGRVYRLRFELRADRPARYLVLRCPLPPGCELQGRPRGAERHDDAVVLAVPQLDVGTPLRLELPVAFGFEGTLLWPPVHVHDMYGGLHDAYGAGSRVRVVPPQPREDAPGSEIAVLTPSWRRAQIEALCAETLREEDPEDARRTLRMIHALRLPLDTEQIEKWLPALFALHGTSDEFCSVLFGLPGVPAAPDAPESLFDWAHAAYVPDVPPGLRAHFAQADDAVFARFLPRFAAIAGSRIEASAEQHFTVRMSALPEDPWSASRLRHCAETALPADLRDELAHAGALVARAERVVGPLTSAQLRALAEALELAQLPVQGAAIAPPETELRAALTGLARRVDVLFERHVDLATETAEERIEAAIYARRWKDVPAAHWPERLYDLYPQDVEYFIAQGDAGRSYLLQHAWHRSDIEDQRHWLRAFTQDGRTDLAAIAVLLRDSEDLERLQPALTRVELAPLRAIVLEQDVAPELQIFDSPRLRFVALRELLRRNEKLPAAGPLAGNAPWALVWRSLGGYERSRVQLEGLLAEGDAPDEFDDVVWRALLPQLSHRLFMRYVGDMTEREKAQAFAMFTPAQRLQALRAAGLVALPKQLAPELLAELRTELWARIVAEPAEHASLLSRFLRDAAGLDFVRSQLACEEEANARIAALLFDEFGLCLPYRRDDELVRISTVTTAAEDRLALRWLERGLAIGKEEIPVAALRRVLRRRGCSLR